MGFRGWFFFVLSSRPSFSLPFFWGELTPLVDNSIDLLVPNPSEARTRAASYPGAVLGPDGEVSLVGVWWRFKGEDEVDKRISRETGWIEKGRPKL